ncbi:unnamed protein product, partial [Allacma fusca]
MQGSPVALQAGGAYQTVQPGQIPTQAYHSQYPQQYVQTSTRAAEPKAPSAVKSQSQSYVLPSQTHSTPD